MGTVIQMKATSTGGTESAIVNIDVPMNGFLVAATWNGHSAYDTTLDLQIWQLSFGSIYTVANDARQVISNASAGEIVVGAAGIMTSVINYQDMLPNLPVGMGERLYIHSAAAASVVGIIHCCLHFDFDLDKVQTRRR